MASILDRVGCRLVVGAWLLLACPWPANAAISEDELFGFLTTLHSTFSSCDMERFSRMLAPEVRIEWREGSRVQRPTRRAFLATWDALCRAGTAPERGFKVIRSNHAVSGSAARIQLVSTKQYPLGIINRRQVRATIEQEFTIKRANQYLQVTGIAEEARYEQLGEHAQSLSAEEALPLSPLARLHRIMLEPWLTSADRELLDQRP